MSQEERRRHPRRDVRGPARLTVNGRPLDAHLRDICRDAALLECDEPLATGTQVRLSLSLPGVAQAIEVGGQVIRTAAGETRPHALAVLFDTVEPGDATRIDFFVALYEESRTVQPD